MLHRLNCLVLLAALALLASPAVAAAVDVEQLEQRSLPETPKLDLARRFTSPFAQLRERKTSRVGLAGAKKRTLSDELLAMLKAVTGPLNPSASPSARPSATWAAKPGASQLNHKRDNVAAAPTAKAYYGASQGAHAAAPTGKPFGPSQGAHAATNTAKPYGASQNAHAATNAAKPWYGASQGAHAASTESAGASHPAPSLQPGSGHAAAPKPQPSALYDSASSKAAKVVEYVKRMIQQEPWESLDSRLLCPSGETACPIFPRMGTYECIDTHIELQSCGGCASKGQGEDCTAIKGAQGVTCESGKCLVYSCEPGYNLEESFRRPNGGKGRCKRTVNPKRALVEGQ
ncbi:hypothetical protein JCM10908_002769 [Rhodotorula pacifica]|uniref:uncharacterized protein n=1 Tax=Rhodotorula pacifica TaxID=1495444 RepID=UPI00316FBC06